MTAPLLSVNALARPVLDGLVHEARRLGVTVSRHASGVTLVDAGIEAPGLHNPHGHPLLFQSLRRGTETTQDLARSTDPAIQALFRGFAAPIRAYLKIIGQGADPLRRPRDDGNFTLGAHDDPPIGEALT